MRALGPGSVSSILKVILDVIHFVLWVGAASIGVGIIAVLLLSARPELVGSSIHLGRLGVTGPWLAPLAAAGLLAVGLYFAGAIVIVGRLRRIFQTLTAGDPFQPANVGRLRTIGATLAVLEVGRYVAAALSHVLFHGRFHFGGGASLTTWFAVLAIVVLAEVFREGARLRGEAELTI
ncbi:MAG: DUF2975 domain-containing protein [Caulobacteraceae bacterium]